MLDIYFGPIRIKHCVVSELTNQKPEWWCNVLLSVLLDTLSDYISPSSCSLSTEEFVLERGIQKSSSPTGMANALCRGVCSFSSICAKFSERQILWSLCSVDFHTVYIAIAYSNSTFCGAWTSQVFVSSLENCPNFRKTSTPQGSFPGRKPPLAIPGEELVFLWYMHLYSCLHCRYLVICYPMKAQYISTVSRARRIILLVWVSAITLAVVPAYFVEHKVIFSLLSLDGESSLFQVFLK